METIKEKEPAQRPAPNIARNSKGKSTTNQVITKENADKCCLWFNPDTLEPIEDSLSQIPAEKVPYGGYVPYVIGTQKQIKSLIRRLKKKPCLVEKYIKIFD
jgi:hypothetical protein